MRSCAFACWRLSPAIPTAMTATCCAAIPSSRWRWTGHGTGHRSRDRPPVTGPALCSQPTVSRIENMPRRTELYRMAQAMLDLYCDSFPVVPNHLTLDLDESFDRGEQQLRKFNAYYNDWGFLPIHIFDTSGRLVVSVLREAATPSGREIL